MAKTNYHILLELHEKQELKPLVKNGLCYFNIVRDMEIYSFVKGLTKTGYPKEKAYFDASMFFGVSCFTIRRAVKKLS